MSSAPPARPRRRAPSAHARAVALVAAAALLLLAGAAPASAPAAAEAPELAARSAVLVEASTGEVVYARAADARRPIASTTKLMTVLLTLEHVGLGDVLSAVRYHAAPAETRINLRPGERMKVSDLLRAALLPSANDAAATLATGVAGSRAAFVRLMNDRAAALGLRHTHYANPVGLDEPGNYSSARDLARLVIALRANRFFRRTVNRPRVTLQSGDHPRTIVNRNPLLTSVPWIDGVKTGHTNRAGYILVGSGSRAGVPMISVVLGEPSEAARANDTLALLRYGMSRYRRARALRAGQVLARPSVRWRDEHVDLVPARPFALVARRGVLVRLHVDAPHDVDGPLPRGAEVGSVDVFYRGRRAAHVPLVTARAVPAAGLGTQIVSYAGRPLTLVLLGAIVVIGVTLTLLRRRATRRRRMRRYKTEAA